MGKENSFVLIKLGRKDNFKQTAKKDPARGGCLPAKEPTFNCNFTPLRCTVIPKFILATDLDFLIYFKDHIRKSTGFAYTFLWERNPGSEILDAGQNRGQFEEAVGYL